MEAKEMTSARIAELALEYGISRCAEEKVPLEYFDDSASDLAIVAEGFLAWLSARYSVSVEAK